MSNWEHKATEELANALVKRIQFARDEITDAARLIGIYKAANRAATVAVTGP
jgi:hypothetical protein